MLKIEIMEGVEVSEGYSIMGIYKKLSPLLLFFAGLAFCGFLSWKFRYLLDPLGFLHAAGDGKISPDEMYSYACLGIFLGWIVAVLLLVMLPSAVFMVTRAERRK